MDDHLTREAEVEAPTQAPAEEPAGLTTPAPEHETSLIDRPWPVWRLVLTLAWPALVQQLLTISVNFSDRLLAGRFQALDAAGQVASQAALTTANYLSFFISSYTVLVCVGSTAVVAHCIGAGDRRSAAHATGQSILLAGLLGLAASLISLVGMPFFLRLLQLEGTAADLAISYLRPILILLPLQVIELAGIACLVGAGDTRIGLWVLGTVAILNVPLSWGFFQGWGPLPALGFSGIALGTGLSHGVGGLLVLRALLRGRAGLRLRLPLLAPNGVLLRRILRVSVPAAADSLSVSAGHLWFLAIVNQLGDVASGAHGIAIYWEALGYLSGAAFGTAAIALVGQNLGAGRPEQAARSGWTAFALGAGVMSLMGVVFFVLARPMFRLFCPDADQQPLVDAGAPALRLVAFAMPALASSIVFTNALRGAGDTRMPVLFTWVGFFCVRIPLATLLTRPEYQLGLLGAWLAMFVDIYLRGAFFLWRFASGRWKRLRV